MTDITLMLTVRRRGAPLSELEGATADACLDAITPRVQGLSLNAFGEVVGRLLADYSLRAFVTGVSPMTTLEDVITRAATYADRKFVAARDRHEVPEELRTDLERDLAVAQAMSGESRIGRPDPE
jgi:hypothetical protein